VDFEGLRTDKYSRTSSKVILSMWWILYVKLPETTDGLGGGLHVAIPLLENICIVLDVLDMALACGITWREADRG